MNTNNHIEIERKYLVRNADYRTFAISRVRIRQGYLSLCAKNSVRVRIWDQQAFLTIKSKIGHNGFSRYEWEKEIPVADAEELLQLAVSGYIDKYRYIVPLSDGLVCEVDEFMGDNEGLVLAEVELPSENMQFVRPDFLGEEVTLDSHYYNSYLSLHPFTTW